MRSSGSSPLTRGAQYGWGTSRGLIRLIPAYAGSTDTKRGDKQHGEAHPRLRGEHLGPRRSGDVFPGSSPLTRGARPAGRPVRRGCGLIPAYAGSTQGNAPPSATFRAHPRLRGEHGFRSTSKAVSCGSSPLTRGALSPRSAAIPFAGLIPAYAGSTATYQRRCRLGEAHPRLRGEHSEKQQRQIRKWGSSPLTRGAQVAYA